MKIGDKVQFIPKHRDSQAKKYAVTGTVVWIHPQGRFALAEYQVMTPIGLSPVLRECIQLR